MLEPDLYHCMDYHAALAPLYLQAKKGDRDGRFPKGKMVEAKMKWHVSFDLGFVVLIFSMFMHLSTIYIYCICLLRTTVTPLLLYLFQSG